MRKTAIPRAHSSLGVEALRVRDPSPTRLCERAAPTLTSAAPVRVSSGMHPNRTQQKCARVELNLHPGSPTLFISRPLKRNAGDSIIDIIAPDKEAVSRARYTKSFLSGPKLFFDIKCP